MFVRITNPEDLDQSASSEAVMSLVCVCTVCLGLLGRQLVFDMGLDARRIVSMIRKYHNHKPQTTPWHREEEPLHHHETPGRQIKQSNQLSLSHLDDCNTIMDIK